MERSERVVLVTGAGSGIGEAVARRLGRDGSAVAVNALTAEQAARVVQQIEAAGGRAVAVVGDVSKPDDAARMVQEAAEQLGGLHVLVNNAGLQKATPFLDLDLDTWRFQLSVDLDGAFLMAVQACRRMAGAGGRHGHQRDQRPRAPAAPRLRGLLHRQGGAGHAD